MIKKVLGVLGAAWVLTTVGLAILDADMCVGWLLWWGGRLKAIGEAVGVAAETESSALVGAGRQW